ncbi:hypothetical protein EON63_21415 [archaeon]|nr:MAG: hypothetical protein EON63_21415 [archaeon]
MAGQPRGGRPAECGQVALANSPSPLTKLALPTQKGELANSHFEAPRTLKLAVGGCRGGRLGGCMELKFVFLTYF